MGRTSSPFSPEGRELSPPAYIAGRGSARFGLRTYSPFMFSGPYRPKTMTRESDAPDLQTDRTASRDYQELSNSTLLSYDNISMRDSRLKQYLALSERAQPDRLLVAPVLQDEFSSRQRANLEKRLLIALYSSRSVSSCHGTSLRRTSALVEHREVDCLDASRRLGRELGARAGTSALPREAGEQERDAAAIRSSGVPYDGRHHPPVARAEQAGHRLDRPRGPSLQPAELRAGERSRWMGRAGVPRRHHTSVCGRFFGHGLAAAPVSVEHRLAGELVPRDSGPLPGWTDRSYAVRGGRARRAPCDVCEAKASASAPAPAPSTSGVDEAFTDAYEAQQHRRSQIRIRALDGSKQETLAYEKQLRALETLQGRCLLCGYLQGALHLIGECRSVDRAAYDAIEAWIQHTIRYERFSGCFDCGLPQAVCKRWAPQGCETSYEFETRSASTQDS